MDQARAAEAEHESLGLYLTGHPFEVSPSIASKLHTSARSRRFCGMHAERRANFFADPQGSDARRRRHGRPPAAEPRPAVLDDDTERIEVTLFDEMFAQSKHLIAKHAVLIVEGQLRYDDFLNGWRVTAKRVRSADEPSRSTRAGSRFAGRKHGRRRFVRDLQRVLKPFTRGRCEVCVEYRSARRRSQPDARRRSGPSGSRASCATSSCASWATTAT